MRRYGSCRKCGATMIFPKYNYEYDDLVFVCSCGYKWTEKPNSPNEGDKS